MVASATAIARVLAGSKHPSIHEADELGMASLVEAAENAGVERFVYVSYAGADADLGTPLERAKTATERRLARSPIRRVVVRPDAFQDIHLAPIGRFDIHDGKVSVFGKGDTKRRWVATDDVAASWRPSPWRWIRRTPSPSEGPRRSAATRRSPSPSRRPGRR